ncbi:hypothetical protein GC175_29330 [bacterium]|nr:hypothetical protein [bacterium]
MTIRVQTDVEIMNEAAQVLQAHMTPSKLVRFWAAWQRGHGDYLQWRDELFADATVEQLYEEVAAYQDKPGNEQ